MLGILHRKGILPIVLGVLLGSLIFATGSSCLAGSEKELLVFHWWTEGGERKAAETLITSFEKKFPGVKVIVNPVAGAGGVNLRAILASQLAAGAAPDSFQTLEGVKIKTYADAGYLAPVDEIWAEENLKQKYLLDDKMMKFGGHYYAVPVHAHRANVIWGDNGLFRELGLTAPDDVDELIDLCQKIEAQKPGVVPLAFGTRYKWPVVYLFDPILVSVAGSDFYKRFYTGKLNVEGNDVFRKALEKFGEVVPFTYRFHASKTCMEACDLIVNGKAAMYIHGDWAYGRFLTAGWKAGEKLFSHPFPSGIWIGHPDCFTLCKDGPNPVNGKRWLRNLCNPQVQIDFSLIKGSTGVVRGIGPDAYPEVYRKDNMKDLNNPAVTKMGNAFAGLTPPDFMDDFQTILERFLYDRDIDRFVEDTQKALIADDVAAKMSWYWE